LDANRNNPRVSGAQSKRLRYRATPIIARVALGAAGWAACSGDARPRAGLVAVSPRVRWRRSVCRTRCYMAKCRHPRQCLLVHRRDGRRGTALRLGRRPPRPGRSSAP
jgi:hypothetical protein